MKKVSSKILLIMLVAIMVLPLKADEKSYKNFEEKIANLQKDNVYWSKIRDDAKKLTKSQKEKHLSQYRVKLMDILDIDEEKWNNYDEYLLSRFYYHKVNINEYEKIEDIFNIELEKLPLPDYELTSKEGGNLKRLKKIIYNDVIVEGHIINRKEVDLSYILEKDSGYSVSEYTIQTDNVFFSDKAYFDKIKKSFLVHDDGKWFVGRNEIETLYEQKNMKGIFFISYHGKEKYIRDKVVTKIYEDYRRKNNIYDHFELFLRNPYIEKSPDDQIYYNYYTKLKNCIKKYVKINNSELFYKREYK